jgi:hypothetical protein
MTRDAITGEKYMSLIDVAKIVAIIGVILLIVIVFIWFMLGG